MGSKVLIATNPKQLDICLKLLYRHGVDRQVNLVEVKRRIEYHIVAFADEQMLNNLEETYRILIS